MKANCTICSDIFDGINTVISTPCGHVFHEICCLQWLEQSRTCPACRQKMNQKTMVRLYFTIGGEESNSCGDDSDQIRNELENAKANLKLKDMEKRKCLTDMDDLRKAVIKAENESATNHQKYLESQDQVVCMRLQLKQSLKEISLLQNVSDENRRLLTKLQHLKNVESIVNDCQGDVASVLRTYGDKAMSKETATYLTLLQRELQNGRDAQRTIVKELRSIKYDLGLKSSQLKVTQKDLQEAKTELSLLREALDTKETAQGPFSRTSPLSASKRKCFSPHLTPIENIPTPFKKPKINMVSVVANKLHDKDATLIRQPQTTIAVSDKNLFRRQDNWNPNNDSVISEGYNGLGGHTKFVSRVAPLKMKFTKSSSHKSVQSKETSNPTVRSFLLKTKSQNSTAEKVHQAL